MWLNGAHFKYVLATSQCKCDGGGNAERCNSNDFGANDAKAPLKVMQRTLPGWVQPSGHLRIAIRV